MITPGRTFIGIGAIFVAALALRLAWVAATDTEIPPLSDPQYYHATASNLADGRGYSVAVNERGFVAGEGSEPTAFWAPGYPFALAPLYAVFGPDERAAKVLNAVAGALTVLPVWFLAARLADRRAAWMSAALFALCPALILWTPALFSEALFTLGVATTLAAGVWASDRRSAWRWLAVGIVLGATALVRSQGLVLVVPLAVLAFAATNAQREQSGSLAPFKRAARVSGVAACIGAGVAALVVPWAIRNERAMGEPWLINNNLGYNLRLAHAPYSTGTSIAPRDLWDERPGISFYERELFWDEVGTHRAWKYAREHPGREAELAVKRVGWLLRSDAAPAMRWAESLGTTPFGAGRNALVLIGDVYWYALLAMSAMSVLLVRRNAVWWAMWSTMGAWVGLHLIFAGEPRYHVPVVPVLCVLAGGVLSNLLSRAIARSDTGAGIGERFEAAKRDALDQRVPQ